MAKYDPLCDYLSARTGTVDLTFNQIGDLVGGLPFSARRYDAWWAGKSLNSSHVQAKAWLSIGRNVERLDRRTGRVWFSAPSRGA